MWKGRACTPMLLCLEFQDSYDQAIAVVIRHLQAPEVELAKLQLSYNYSFHLAITNYLGPPNRGLNNSSYNYRTVPYP